MNELERRISEGKKQQLEMFEEMGSLDACINNYSKRFFELSNLKEYIIEMALKQKVAVEIRDTEIGLYKWSVFIPKKSFTIDLNSFLSKEDAIDYCNEEGLSFTVR